MLRADGTPTYNLSVVVDDHDMGITHVIRGDDHLNNAFRQMQIYRALGWAVPEFAHVPLIHGPDGAKLSKRHGALGVDAYRDLGYLPEALRNYLLRLGWSHGDDEIISTEQAIDWFDIGDVGRAAGALRLRQARQHLNGALHPRCRRRPPASRSSPSGSKRTFGRALSEIERERLLQGDARAEAARRRPWSSWPTRRAFYVAPRPIRPDDKAARLLTAEARAAAWRAARAGLRRADVAAASARSSELRAFAEQQGLKLGVGRAAAAGRADRLARSPGIFEVMEVLGRDESLGRIADAAAARARAL